MTPNSCPKHDQEESNLIKQMAQGKDVKKGFAKLGQKRAKCPECQVIYKNWFDNTFSDYEKDLVKEYTNLVLAGPTRPNKE